MYATSWVSNLSPVLHGFRDMGILVQFSLFIGVSLLNTLVGGKPLNLGTENVASKNYKYLSTGVKCIRIS